MSHYMFETEWQLTAPIDRVFDVLIRVDQFAKWWPSVKSSRSIEVGDDNGVGAKAEYTLRSPLGYSMRFETTGIDGERPNRIRSTVRGDLIGTGTYFLTEADEATSVRLNWYVSTTKRWMNLVGGLAKPLLAFSYHHVMREGCAAMASHSGARLLATKTALVEKPTPVPVLGDAGLE